jgi:hypothetical protein
MQRASPPPPLLLLRSFGPRQVLAEELEGIEGVESAYLFGSWAARYMNTGVLSPW